MFLIGIAMFIACNSTSEFAMNSIPVSLEETDKFYDTCYLSKCRELYLETNKSSVVNAVSKIIETNDGLICIFDLTLNQIVVFDSSGKYVRTINHTGRGPGEYIHISDVTYDKSTDELLCLVDPTAIMHYSTNGKFLKKESLDNYYTDIAVDSQYIYLYNYTYTNMVTPEYTIDCINKSTGEHHPLLPFDDEYAPFCSIGSKLFHGEGGYYFVRKFDNHIYQLCDGKINNAYEIDLGTHQFPAHELNKKYDCGELFSYCHKKEFSFLFKNVIVGKNQILFSSNLDDIYIISKDNKTGKRYTYMVISEYGIPTSALSHIDGSTDKCAFVLYPSSFISIKKLKAENCEFDKMFNFPFTDAMQAITEESNPVIFIYSLK